MDFLKETAKTAIELQTYFKCLSCKKLPTEPYFTGICDHLLCKDCITKSNSCSICGVSFFSKESNLNTMFKEAILYVNTIIELTQIQSSIKINKENNEKIDELDSSLPSIDLATDNLIVTPEKEAFEQNSLNEKIQFTKRVENIFLVPMSNIETDDASVIKKSRLTRERKNQKEGTILRTQRNKSVPVNLDNNELSQSVPLMRTQSVKRSKKNDKGETALHLAVMNANIEKVKILLQDKSNDVNSRDYAGWTPLHEACNQGSLEIAKLLVDHNADINAFGYQKNTPLHEAALHKNYDCVEFLLDKGANITLRNEAGFKARDYVKSQENFVNLFNSYASNHDLLSQNDLNQSQFNQTIGEDLNISCTFKNNRKARGAKAPKKCIIFGTGMNEQSKQKLNTLARKLNLTVAKEMKYNVTHVLFDGENTCARTLNYMKGILMGIWIVSLKWLEDSVEKGFLLEENEYEAKGSSKLPFSNGPYKGRMNFSCQYPKLFEDCNFYLQGEFVTFDKDEFIKLIELGGGKILKREPKLDRLDELISSELPHHLDIDSHKDFECSHFILSDSSKCKEINHKYLQVVKTNWLFTCIDEFKILYPSSAIFK